MREKEGREEKEKRIKGREMKVLIETKKEHRKGRQIE